MKKRRPFLSLILAAIFFVLPLSSKAAMSGALLQVYNQRGDLQTAFDSSGNAVPNTAAGFLINFEDWARQYGWREHQELAEYAPIDFPSQIKNQSLPDLTAEKFIIVDKNSGLILAEHNSDDLWPMASITKLMTSHLVIDSGTSFDITCAVSSADDVGGAKLYVSDGATFSLRDLLYATLVSSANNAANAISRVVDNDKENFVRKMNAEACNLGLVKTKFVDPSGIEVENVSTAREVAYFARQFFADSELKSFVSTASKVISVLSTGESKNLTSTNWMLWKPEYDDIYVMAGKTGYLDESGWNLVVSLRPELENSKEEILLVVFGAGSRTDSFRDARALADWTWESFEW
ncbi:MAG: D-alanyl-D-alanine carboxypeptidase [Candidatus Uhrbacteria bacterium GW2011_GWE2_45_35]|uniref:D-alanyl-D-alanine carboxypeptidase n=2 Tax=Candidatus Uhriibacteriota TaxID=1752732 RepID=A0A0G1MB54_9BACT|nr:MAG: D-alanyl-D-alanine carboxypeptidase [Candidatus Uhrbacteria bacterium GW2011_GWF2_44_350]KKU06472.1 MAG: D-alanyl-D-alanine carboxypeptidase [Candidatus Uhrbacteria bacterium GW2011_GWE2_45_35]HBR80367.1 hypothetical protein [Candidatus Uhrbacteria bacterium]HCU32125.1 hypothetical protein [Candidatus Uhrbacteria bacterium]